MNTNSTPSELSFPDIAQYALDSYYQVSGRVHMLLSHILSSTKQPLEYKVFLRLLHGSDYSESDKQSILSQDVICYNVGGADISMRSNLIVYTVDGHGNVTRWGCYHKGEKKRDNGTIEDFQSAIPQLDKRGYEFMPSGV